MAKCKIVKLALVFLVALVVLGCGSPGGSGPSKKDVGAAVGAMDAGWNMASYTGTYTPAAGNYTSAPTYSDPSGGTVSASYTTSADPSINPFTIDGVVHFTNFHEAASGYTINGTISVSISSSASLISLSYPQTLTITYTCDLTLSGGAISRLTGGYKIVYTFTGLGKGTSTASGTLYVDGSAFDTSELTSS